MAATPAGAASPGPTPGAIADGGAGSTAAAAGEVPGPELVALLTGRYGLSDRQVSQLATYLDYMLEINQSMNLTAVRDKADAWQRHVVDSLALLPVLERHAQQAGLGGARAGTGAGTVAGASGLRRVGTGSRSEVGAGEAAVEGAADASVESGSDRARSSEGASGSGAAAAVVDAGLRLRLVDVGTGAGLPGMVLAAARPQWKVTLLDSLRKRCDFLREAAARAGLSNVDVVWCRAEEGGHRPELRQAYDVAVARAVAEARVLAELCLPFVRVGGLWLAAKGPDPEAEVTAAASAIRQLGGRQLALERVESYSSEGQRTALLVAKSGPTPQRFPRAPGTPGKKPL
ncbi:hypothetical protein GPECTOR_2g1116 [Gonium pectorale]|uniref:Ribosomal RNA small subunit methyltransferase G n=1 Tax=Gonium pectorale TaxID=33097 RepID=A0A150H073_GONPE|nr:hypothetical protein GPECTOR_2g1116 [Gonium pectorale]|eukprot:KXZ55567.1 hypothetical protein GPECTOR_2g1116 [Gonium pectorale]